MIGNGQEVLKAVRFAGISFLVVTEMAGVLFIYAGLQVPDDSYWQIVKLLAFGGGGLALVLGTAGLIGTLLLNRRKP